MLFSGSSVNPGVVEQDMVQLKANLNSTLGEEPQDKQQLEEQLQKTQKSAYTQGTYKNLLCQWRAFFRFCAKFKIKEWPVKEHTLCLFAQYLAHRFIPQKPLEIMYKG